MHLARAALPVAPSMTLQDAAPPQLAAESQFWPAWLDTILTRWAEREQLLGLDERELRDIGLTPTEALALAQRSLWRG
jgi:uncharacterized protein YjiS (DUF1127 family)